MVGDNLALPGPLPQLALCCLDQWSREGERERKKEREVEKETEVGRERGFFVCCIRITQIIFFIFPAHAPGATAPCLGTHCHAQGSMCAVFSEEHYIHSTPPGRAHSKHALTTKYRQINNKKKIPPQSSWPEEQVCFLYWQEMQSITLRSKRPKKMLKHLS